MSNSISEILFPEIEPYNHGLIVTKSIHEVYFEECGNPNGTPVIFLHGGPGSGCNPAQRRFFDPKVYRIILMDQRGCGRSKPQGATEDNTIDALIQDMEQLREHLSIKQWHIFGGSWGSTLAITYACTHTDKVLSLALRGIFLSQAHELNWFLGDIAHFYPAPWQALCDYLPEHERDDVLTNFEKRIFSDDASISVPAAFAWNAYEGSIMTLLPKEEDNKAESKKSEADQARAVSAARVQIHYIKYQCFVGQRNLLQEAQDKLSHIPTIIVQGRYDMVCPPQTAWQLSKAMPHAKFVMVPDAGHSAMELGTCKALVEATETFKEISH